MYWRTVEKVGNSKITKLPIAMKSNYLCLIELLNFDKNVSAFGNDMLQITINKISKDLAATLAESEQEVSCCIFGDSILIQTDSDSDEDLSKLVRVLSAYNKQALMFGYPHKGIVLKQTSVAPLCEHRIPHRIDIG